MELILNSQEEELLTAVLQQYQRELLLEISHADHREFKTALRARAQVLETLIERVHN